MDSTAADFYENIKVINNEENSRLKLTENAHKQNSFALFETQTSAGGDAFSDYIAPETEESISANGSKQSVDSDLNQTSERHANDIEVKQSAALKNDNPPTFNPNEMQRQHSFSSDIDLSKKISSIALPSIFTSPLQSLKNLTKRSTAESLLSTPTAGK